MNNWPTIKTMPQWATQEIVKADGGQTVTPVLYSTKTSMTSNPIKPQDHVDLTDMFKMSKNSIGNSLQWVANKIYKATRGSTLTPLSPVKTTTTTSKATLAQQRNPTRKEGSSATTTTSKAMLARQRNLDSKDRPSATTTTASKANLAQQRNPANKDESSAGCNTKTSPIAGGHGEPLPYSRIRLSLGEQKPHPGVPAQPPSNGSDGNISSTWSVS